MAFVVYVSVNSDFEHVQHSLTHMSTMILEGSSQRVNYELLQIMFSILFLQYHSDVDYKGHTVHDEFCSSTEYL